MDGETQRGRSVPLIWHAVVIVLTLSALSFLLPHGPVSETLQGARITMAVAVLVIYAGRIREALFSRVRAGWHPVALMIGAWAFSHLYFASWRFVVEVFELSSDVLTSRANNIVFAVVVIAGVFGIAAFRIEDSDFRPTREVVRRSVILAVGTGATVLLLRLVASG